MPVICFYPFVFGDFVFFSGDGSTGKTVFSFLPKQMLQCFSTFGFQEIIKGGDGGHFRLDGSSNGGARAGYVFGQ